jgi:hypothetical protein
MIVLGMVLGIGAFLAQAHALERDGAERART